MDPHSLETLLERWSDALDQGRDLPAAELCRDRPELAEELERRMAECRRMSALMRQLATPTVHDAPPTLPPQDQTPGFPPLPTSLSAMARRAQEEGPVTVPGYQVIREVGRGGMGVVYLARELELGRFVALKMLPGSARVGAEAVDRFRQEALAVARLSHPGTVQIYQVGEVPSPSGEPRPYLAMEYCPGGTLQERLGGKPLPPREAARVVEALARTMHAVHGARVVHQDLKPGNVLLANPPVGARSVSEGFGCALAVAAGSDLMPKIADFGLAKRLDCPDSTLSGLVLGTPSYMAPEQAEGRTREVGPLADVWALGAILYECLTGRPPFLGASALETLQQVSRHDPAAPLGLNPACPRDLETIALKCLQKAPARRYASAEALADDLARFRAGRPILARPAGRRERLARWAVRRPCQTARGVLALVGLAAVLITLLLHGAEQRRLTRLREDFANRLNDAEESADQAKPQDTRTWGRIRADLQSALEGIAKEPALTGFRLRGRAVQLRDRALDMLARQRIRAEERDRLAKGGSAAAARGDPP
jgi:serine/threonine protein kinase